MLVKSSNNLKKFGTSTGPWASFVTPLFKVIEFPCLTSYSKPSSKEWTGNATVNRTNPFIITLYIDLYIFIVSKYTRSNIFYTRETKAKMIYFDQEIYVKQTLVVKSTRGIYP